MTALPRLLLLLALAAHARADILVEDDLGREVRLAAPATRILTLAPHATEMILALGAENKLVAVARFFGYPDSLDRVPRINTLGSLDREYLLEMNPDLVLAWRSGNRPADLQWLVRTGIPVFMSEPASLTDIAISLEKLGRLTGKTAAGKEAASAFSQGLDSACANRQTAVPVPSYFQIWADPPMTIGGNHWLNEILERAGLHNVFADVPRNVFTVNPESLLARDIRAIIASQPDASRPIRGVRILKASPELGRPGPRLVDGLKQLCAQM